MGGRGHIPCSAELSLQALLRLSTRSAEEPYRFQPRHLQTLQFYLTSPLVLRTQWLRISAIHQSQSSGSWIQYSSKDLLQLKEANPYKQKLSTEKCHGLS